MPAKKYAFNTAERLNKLLLYCLLSTGQPKEGEGDDVDFNHQFIEAEKFDAKPTYKKFRRIGQNGVLKSL